MMTGKVFLLPIPVIAKRGGTGPGARLKQSIDIRYPGRFRAYRDLQRHRMLTQERQLLHPDLGYDIPEEMEIIDGKKFMECFERFALVFSDEESIGTGNRAIRGVFGYEN
jgi:hypothetical protein